eukprot:scaffold150_cov16-Prasinocladus_malaysianus.AAC.1
MRPETKGAAVSGAPLSAISVVCWPAAARLATGRYSLARTVSSAASQLPVATASAPAQTQTPGDSICPCITHQRRRQAGALMSALSRAFSAACSASWARCSACSAEA